MQFLRKNILCTCLLISLVSISTKAQTSDFRTQRAQLAVFNIGLNGLFGGLGSLINQNKGSHNFHTFINGFYKGAIGGGISHVGFSMTNLVYQRKNIAYAWPARLVNSLGSSMVQNAAENKELFERLHFNLYLTRLEYHSTHKRFTIRLFTSSIYGLAIVGKNAKFDLGKTLKSGILYFESTDRFSSSLGSGRATGQVSSIGMSSSLTGDRFYDIFAEEVAHILQYDRKVGGNALALKLDENFKNTSPFYNSLSKYIYFDLNGPLFWAAYKIQNNTSCNFFEQEAVNYANRRIDPC